MENKSKENTANQQADAKKPIQQTDQPANDEHDIDANSGSADEKGGSDHNLALKDEG